MLLTALTAMVQATPAPVPDAGDQAVAEAAPIVMARATWDTGWFQTEVIRFLLEELGYRVADPITMDNLAFYRSAARGDVDLWANGWFPGHNAFLEVKGVQDKVAALGFEVKAGALQGYLADKKTVEALNIKSLSDLKNPEVARAFDRDGNGKADLIGCNVGWGCELVIEHQLDAYGLRETVEHVQGDYSPMMVDSVKRYRRGEPILFYTWTPNWTVGSLVPGKDVVWIEVPFASLPAEQKSLEKQIAIPEIPGCGRNPCQMGFPPNDIRVVANKAFLSRHPDVRKLLALAEIPLEDISRQNARMIDGEDRYADIQRHAREWIKRHRHQIDLWLEAARALQPSHVRASGTGGDNLVQPKPKRLRVVTQQAEPFVIYRNKRYDGFSIQLWEEIAGLLNLEYEIYGVNTIAKLLDEVKRGAADAAIAGIGITSQREEILDFSHSFFESGLQIMVPAGSESIMGEVITTVLTTVFSKELIYGVVFFLVVLLLAAHVIWALERRDNPQFPKAYLQGLWHSVWWAVVTVTTVGYGDKTPKGVTGRIFGLIWILAGYFVFAYFTASVTSTVTVQELHGMINGPEDLFGKRVATVAKSTAAEYLSGQGLSPIEVETIENAYRQLKRGKVEAVVYDAPVLQHYASKQGRGTVKVVGLLFQEKSYGIALQADSIYRDQINVALLKLIESGMYQNLSNKWFGS
jgi:ABC-type proline/glycine betaine transport system substrate-binding protein/ABC-type amino acid transport substrate-binding protein